MMNFRALCTPPHDGAILIEPAAADLGKVARENRARLSDLPGGVDGVPWAKLRREARLAIGADADRPIVMTGHQPEFIHPGVWSKHIVAQRLAQALGGTAVNLVVDNDAPKTLSLAVPVAKDGDVELHHVPFAEMGAGLPYEFLASLDAEAIQRIREETARLMGESYEASAMPAFFEGFGSSKRGGFAAQMVAGRKAAEELFGVAVLDTRVSEVWGGPMLADWILRAAEFANAYNRALAEYREEEGVRSPDRPIPDLRVAGTRVESPLWIYRQGETRRRLSVERAGTEIRLFAEDEPVGVVPTCEIEQTPDPAALVRNASGRVVRPRALTLTLWARLLASDLFIHGIGGAKYDRITDKIIRSYYGVEPPAMACVSATLHLPLPRTPVDPREATAARRWLRDVQYQPERWATDIPEALPLLGERLDAIERSETLRRDANGRQDHAARRETFERIHEINARLLAMQPDIIAEAQARVERLRRLAMRERIAAGREYFFALFPRAKLETLCAALPAAGSF